MGGVKRHKYILCISFWSKLQPPLDSWLQAFSTLLGLSLLLPKHVSEPPATVPPRFHQFHDCDDNNDSDDNNYNVDDDYNVHQRLHQLKDDSDHDNDKDNDDKNGPGGVN